MFFMNNKKIAEKGQHISWAISIIGGLRDSLDMEKGGEISINLDSLYEYCCATLLEANLKNIINQIDQIGMSPKTYFKNICCLKWFTEKYIKTAIPSLIAVPNNATIHYYNFDL